MNTYILQLFGITYCVALAFGWEVQVERLEEANDNDPFFDISKLKVERINRGVYGFNGVITIKEELDQNIMVTVKAYYSAIGNGQFILIPLSIPTIDFCSGLNIHYKKYLMEELSKVSNFPYITDDEYVCPLKMGDYSVNMYKFDNSALPAYMKPGLYKIDLFFNSTKDDRWTKWNVIAKVTDE